MLLVLVLCMVAEVANADFIFGEPTNLGSTVNSSSTEGPNCFSSDGLSLYLTSDRSGGLDIWVTTRETINDDWGTPVNLGPPVNQRFISRY